MTTITDENVVYATETIPQDVRDRLYILAEKFNNDVLLQILKDMPVEISFDYFKSGYKSRYTPLTKSVMIVDSTEMFDLLIEAGASIDQRDGYRKTALETAIDIGHVDAVEDCIKHKSDVNLFDMDGNSPLIRSILRGEERTVDLLIDHGADINLPSKSGDHPVIIAENMGNEYVLTRLKEHKNFNGHYNLNNKDLVRYDLDETHYLEEGKYLYNLSLSVNNKTIPVDTTIAIGNVFESTELELASPDRIAHHVSTVDSDLSPAVNSSGWIAGGLGSAGIGVGLVAGIYYIHRVFGQTRTYNKSIQAAQHSSV